MQVRRIATTGELQQYSATWNTLTQGVPFRSWEWLSTWWDHYGAGRELYILAVHDDCALVGILPLFCERSATRGRVLQLLGSGEVCTDYVTVLSTAAHEDAVLDAIASWMIDAGGRNASHEHQWDLLELGCVLTSDVAISRLIGTLADAGCGVHRKPGPNCWKLALPTSWDDVYARLSKNRRKAFRKLQRDVLDRGRLVFKTAGTPEELDSAMVLFIDLHQKRRISLGEAGCFASKQFAAFMKAVSTRLFAAGMLELSWIELDGHPVAVDFCLVDTETIYGYQGGIDPMASGESPGHLMTMAQVQNAISSSRNAYDLLRGDEPYKADWKAEPRATINLRVSANRAASQVRQGVWLAAPP